MNIERMFVEVQMRNALLRSDGYYSYQFSGNSSTIDINYLFKDLLPNLGKPLRNSQLEMAIAIQKAISLNKKFVAEAEVGTGKTFAYIVPMYNLYVKTKKPILISTSSIVLQEQLIYKDLKEIGEILINNEYIESDDYTYCLLKGKENYLCEDRLEKMINRNIMHQVIERVTNDYEKLGYIDRNEFSYVDDILWQKINIKSCSNKCKYRDCKFRALKARRNEKNIFYVCNHHYLISCLKDRNFALEQYSAIVIDEAHNLENAAFSILGDSMNFLDFENLYNKFLRMVSKGLYYRKDLINMINELRSTTNQMYITLEKDMNIKEESIELENKYDLHITDEIRKIIIEIRNGIYYLYNNQISLMNNNTKFKSRREDQELEREVDIILMFLDRIIDKDNNVTWGQFSTKINESRLSISYIPRDIDELLYSSLLKNNLPIIFTSATLSDSTNIGFEFDYFQNNIGLSYVSNSQYQMPISKKSNFDYITNCGLYIEKEIPYVNFKAPGHDEYMRKKAQRIFQIIESTQGRSLVLFTSYKSLNYTVDIIRKEIEEKLNISCYVQGDASNKELYNKFKDNINSCLFATGGFWEGIDVKGESLSCVIIDKLPFPVKDPIIKLKYERSEAVSLKEILIPEMIIKLKQGIGRLIRDKDDRGIVAILDSRAATKYAEIVNANLPICKAINSIEEFEIFLSSKM